MAEKGSSNGGVGFASLLALLFIGLKLGHVIDWPWLWVLAPLWIVFGFAVAVLLVVLIVIGVRKW